MSTTPTLITTILRADGFSCPSCVAKIEKQVGRVTGVETVTVHFASARIEVTHHNDVDPADLVAAVKKAGYVARLAAF